MTLVPSEYLAVIKRRDFFILLLTLFLGQVASAFLLLSLVASVFTQTASNFGVTGIVLSLSTPAFFLMAFAGLTADIIDRKKIIIIANIVISVIVLLVLLMLKNVYVSISLSFLYFAGNSFFLPAISAASAQLVKKSQLLIANSLFIFTLSSGQIIGLFIASIIQFIYGNLITLVICEVLLIIAIFLPMSLVEPVIKIVLLKPLGFIKITCFYYLPQQCHASLTKIPLEEPAIHNQYQDLPTV